MDSKMDVKPIGRLRSDSKMNVEPTRRKRMAYSACYLKGTHYNYRSGMICQALAKRRKRPLRMDSEMDVKPICRNMQIDCPLCERQQELTIQIFKSDVKKAVELRKGCEKTLEKVLATVRKLHEEKDRLMNRKINLQQEALKRKKDRVWMEAKEAKLEVKMEAFRAHISVNDEKAKKLIEEKAEYAKRIEVNWDILKLRPQDIQMGVELYVKILSI